MLLVYSRHFQNGFHFDDSHTVVDNPAIRDLASNWKRILTDATAFSVLPSNQTWRPLVTLSLAVDYRLGGGLRPWAFHLDSFTVFLLMLVGFYVLARHWLKPARAALATAVLGLHPVMAETVNYVIQRGDVYTTAGWTWGMALYARGNPLWPLPFLLGGLSKPTGLVFPLLLAAFQLCRRRPDRAGLGLALGLGLGLAALNLHFLPASFRGGGASHWAYWWTQPAIIAFYLASFFLPLHLSADTDWTCFASPWSPPALLGDLVLLGLLLVLLRAFVRRQELLAFGLSWFLLGLSLTSLMPLAEVCNDHRMCLAYPGLVLAMFSLPARADRFKPILLIWLLILCALTWERNLVWRDELSLWSDVTQKSPGNGRGWMNYGLARMARADYAEARKALERAVQLAPDYSLAHLNLAICLAAQGQLPAARAQFDQADGLDRQSPEIPFYRARWLASDQPAQAREWLRLALGRRPAYQAAFDSLCQLELDTGNWEELRRDLGWSQDYPGYEERREHWQARQHQAEGEELRLYQGRLRREASLQNYLDLSYVLWKQRQPQAALSLLERAIRRYPKEPRLYNNQAAAWLQLERWSEAAASAQVALRLQPDFSLARSNLEMARAKLRR